MYQFLESILYGFVSGCAEILPISADAHRSIMMKLCGVDMKIPLMDLFVHLALLVAVFYCCRNLIVRIRHEARFSGKNRRHTYDNRGYHELRLLKAITVPMVIGIGLRLLTVHLTGNYLLISLFLLINGAFLLLQDHLPYGNKTAGKLSGLDGIIAGILSALSVFPGISRNGVILSYAIARGSDRTSVINWILLLMIPALIVLCVLDIVAIFTVGFGITSFVGFLYCLLASITAFIGAYLSIRIIRILAVNTGYSFFAYYSVGAALFSLVLYLIS